MTAQMKQLNQTKIYYRRLTIITVISLLLPVKKENVLINNTYYAIMAAGKLPGYFLRHEKQSLHRSQICEINEMLTQQKTG